MAEGANMDMPAHERGYANFIKTARGAAIVVAIIALSVILIIAR